MAENHLDFIFMKKDGKDPQIYRVGEPELAGLLLAIDVTTATIDAFNNAINNYLNTRHSLDPLLKADEPAHDAEIIYNRAHPDTTKTFKLAVYFNTSNTANFGTMHPVTYDATGEITTVAAALALGANLPPGPPTNGAVNPMNGITAAEYQILEFTAEDIVTLKSIIKGDGLENLATKIQLVTQSFRLLYSKILGDAITDPKMTVNTKITDIINVAVADADAFKAYCGVLVDLGKAYKGPDTFDGVSVELDISYPDAVGATPIIKSQQSITDQTQVNNLFNFAKTCLGATVTNLTGGYKIGGFKKRRTKRRRNKSSKRRSQKRSKRGRKRSNKRKGKKSRRRMRKSYKK